MLNVLIAEDNVPASVHLSNTINTSNVRCIGILNNGTKVYEKMKELNPDVLLLDLKMPGKNGINILQEIQNDKELNTKVFIYSGEMEYIAVARKYSCVDKFYYKTTPAEQISKELEEVSNNLYHDNTENRIIEILLKLGFAYTLRGTRFLNDCILYSVVNNEDKINNIYEEIAKSTSENVNTIKSNINTAISNMCKFTDKVKTRKILRLGEHEKPSAKIIISMVKYYIEK